MSWLLVLSLFSNPDGNYVREFSSEQACVVALNKFVKSNKSNHDVKYVGCVSSVLALNESQND